MQNFLSLFAFVINVIIIKVLNKFLRVRHSILRIYLFRRSTLLLSLCLHFLKSSFKLLLKCLSSHNTNLFSEFSIFLKNNICITCTYYKFVNTFKVFRNITTNNIVHYVKVTHSSRKTSILFFITIIRI